MHLYYMAKFQKDWKLPNSWNIWLSEYNIDHSLEQTLANLIQFIAVRKQNVSQYKR